MDGVHRNETGLPQDVPLVLVIARCIIGSIGIIANSIGIFVFVYNRTYKKSLSFKLFLHQTVIDLIGSLMFLIFFNIKVPDGTAGTIFCKMQFFFHYMVVTSTFNFVMLTVERYIAIIHPLLYRQKSVGGKITYLSLISPHVCGIILTIFVPIYADVQTDVKMCMVQGMSTVGGILLITVQFLVPICIMLYCYVKMLLKLHKIRIVSHELSTEFQPRNGGQVEGVKSDLLTTLILIAFVYIVTTIPGYVCTFIYFIGSGNFNLIFQEISVLLMDLNLTFNPFIYCTSCKDFRRGLRKIRDDLFHG
ncbi:G-protein coupled receptor 183-like [Anneissia japonica]|uniref:G-protein coupled receptor 183-like n=1 Tax=Anneissia japonica TaxID=1529436 RepID=UPI00142569A4|nr:G-protein coupled receptor 183-like [Anneissia japonica]